MAEPETLEQANNYAMLNLVSEGAAIIATIAIILIIKEISHNQDILSLQAIHGSEFGATNTSEIEPLPANT